jgi:hypothetical protein
MVSRPPLRGRLKIWLALLRANRVHDAKPNRSGKMISSKHETGDVAPSTGEQLADEALVVPGCTDLQQFLEQAQWLAPWPEQSEPLAQQARQVAQREAFGGAAMLACHPGDPNKVLVIRGFNNLLHYLDWFDAIHPAH